MKAVNYCRKSNTNQEKIIKLMEKMYFKKHQKCNENEFFVKLKFNRATGLNTFLKRSLHDLLILFIEKMIWMLKH